MDNRPIRKESQNGATELATRPAGMLTATEFLQLSELPAEEAWFQEIRSVETRRAYRGDVQAFMAFVGISQRTDLRLIARGHLLAWRKDLERQNLSSATIRRKLAALSSLFEFLANENAIAANPCKGVKRPRKESNEGSTPAFSMSQARTLLNAPDQATAGGRRDALILSILLHHGLRRAELCALSVGDVQQRDGVDQFRVFGKGGKVRYVPIHPHTQMLLDGHVQAMENQANDAPLITSHRGRSKGTRLQPDGVYKCVVKRYGQPIAKNMKRMGPHALRATAATAALENNADLARVQAWLGHANISTTKIYDKRANKASDSPTFAVRF